MTYPQAVVWDRPADRVRVAANDRIQRVRDNADMSPSAKLREVAKAHLDAKAQLDGLAAQAAPAKAASVADATRRLYGIEDITAKMSPAETTAASMSFRDAQARAATVGNPTEAAQLLDQADATGDELLSRAIGNASITGGMHTVREKYFAARPNKARAFDDLQRAALTPSAAQLFEFAWTAPSELNGMRDDEIARVAKS